MKKLATQQLFFVFVLMFSSFGFAQQVKPVRRVDQKQLKPKTEIKGVQVEQTSNDPENVEIESTEQEAVFIRISNPASMRLLPAEEVELTKEQKIEKLNQEIESIEAKIYHLQGDPVENAQEIQEKQTLLDAKWLELNLLENN